MSEAIRTLALPIVGLLLAGAVGCTEITVTGVVETTDGIAVDDAEIVDLYDETHVAESDASGEFAIRAKKVDVGGSKQALLEVRADGFAPQVTPVPHKSNVGQYVVPIRLVPVQETPVIPGEETVLSGSAGGNAFTVRVEPLSNEGLFLRVAGAGAGEGPGTMRDVDDDPDYGLQTGGMFYVSIVDEEGEEFQGSPRVRIEMAGFSLEEAEGAGGLNSYGLNGDGLWEQDDSLGDPSDGEAFDASFPGWTNCDRSILMSCIRGRIVTESGAACGGGRITASGPGSYESFDSSGEQGQFCVTGGVSQTSSIRVDGIEVSSMMMPSGGGNCTQPDSCLDVGTITVDAETCGELTDPPPGPPDGPEAPDDGVSSWCQDFIDNVHQEFDDIYDGDPCGSACAHDYYDCLAADDCEFADACDDSFHACLETCYY